jgi:hypothetical protein
MTMIEKLDRSLWPVRRVWGRLLGLFSERRRFSADVLDALSRGDSNTIFAWWWDEAREEEEECELDDLMADIDEAIRRAPSPVGIDEFFLDITVCKELRHGAGGRLEGRKVLRYESFVLDRYYDWRKGDARARVRAILEEVAPCPQAPLVAVEVQPIGGAIASLYRQGMWQPVSPWMR